MNRMSPMSSGPYSSRTFLLGMAFLLFAAPAFAQISLSDLLGDPNALRCESNDGRVQRCPLPEGTRAEFLRQQSRSACVAGTSYRILEREVEVSQGCRADFRLVAQTYAPLTGTELTQSLRTSLATAMVARLKADYPSAANPQFLPGSDQERFISSAEVGFSGQGRASLDGVKWQQVSFDSLYSQSRRAITQLSYRLGETVAPPTVAWQPGRSMDVETRAVLLAAIKAELLKDKSVKAIQLVINDRYYERADNVRDVRFKGLFGVSINDGDWKTRTYETFIYLPKDQIKELKLDTPR